MMKRIFAREEFHEILEENNLGCEVSYVDRPNNPNKGILDNWIVYHRQAPNNQLFADGRGHMRKARILITHFHKKKLDSIGDFMFEKFGISANGYAIEQPKTDYLGTYYALEIFEKGGW